MATQTFGQYGVSGVNKPIVTYRTDLRAGRIDFQIRNYGTASVKVRIAEAEVDGTLAANLVNDTAVNPGGVIDLSINSAKGTVTIYSGSGNTGSSNIYLSANFFGLSFYGGNLSDMESINRSGFFAGTDLPTGVRD